MEVHSPIPAEALGGIPLFSGLTKDELSQLVKSLDARSIGAGEVLFHEGEPGEQFFLVVEGELEVLKGVAEADELLLNVLRAGEYLGEMSLILPGGHRTASVRARVPSVLLSMSRAQFMGLLQRHPTLATSMVRVLSERLDATNISSFRDLTEKNRQLQQAYDELKAAQAQLIEKERLERELQLAAEIQLSILPDELPQIAGYDFGARILAARQVGGDFYDVFEPRPGQIGVLVGDVADKGIPSALFMARAHALIMAEADSARTPAEVMALVNHHITRLQHSTQFVTVLYGLLDVASGDFKYARAGHEPPLLLTGDGSVARLPHGTGMSLGLWDQITVDEQAVQLPPGSTLLLYTDGLTDCRNPEGDAFGLERIKATMTGLVGLTAQRVCDVLLETLHAHQHGAIQDDDVTLTAIHVAPLPAAPAS